MPSFALRMNTEDSFRNIGNYPCYGWMAALREMRPTVSNTPDEHIAEIRVSYSGMDAWGDDNSNRDLYFEKIIELCNATPTLKGRVSLAPSVNMTHESEESATERYGNSLQINLVGIPMDVLMLHLFMLRNLSGRQCFYIFKYLLEKGVPIKVAALIGSSFYVSVGASLGTSSNWALGHMSGDSTIISSGTTIAEARNFAFGSGFEGHQPKWGDNEERNGYMRDGTNDLYITNAFRRNPNVAVPRTESISTQFHNHTNSREGAWEYLNTTITQIVGKDFNISYEDANDKIQRIGR